ncbi:hypothetical protein GCM10022239_27020 [Leifsonia bigeumensis]|uniref:DUF7507 domain-containing protein n=2 Tax=Leifsonella bigeumensis TaxID=433643 RepID=A0ABP7FYM7_9MICO
MFIAQPALAVPVALRFDTVTVTANPNGYRIDTIGNTIDGSTSGGNYGRIFTNRADAAGVVIEYGFATPKMQLNSLRLWNNGGGILTDEDGIGGALVEVFDASDNLLWSGPLTAGNGGGIFVTAFPSPLDGVSTVRLSQITNLGTAAAPDIIWRELQAMQNVPQPTLTTQISSDGFSDDVTVSATEGLAGSLDWTLYGPVPAVGDACTGLDWTGAPVFASGTVAVTGDGTMTTTPAGVPTAGGCYSYGDVLSSPYYSDVVSAVGQPAETFFISAPAIDLVKSASPLTITVGVPITYTFVVTNSGNVDLSNPVVTEVSFNGANLAGMTAPDCGSPAPTLLAPGAQMTCTATYTPVQADVDGAALTNTATATGTPPSGPAVVSPLRSVMLPAVQDPSIDLVKTAGPGDFTTAGQVVTYSFLVTNTGNVTLTDVGVAEGTFTGFGTMSAPVCPVGATSMAPGAQVTCTATYALTQADVDFGEITNTASSTGSPPTGPVTVSAPDDAVVLIEPSPAITVLKSASGGPFTGAGQLVDYSFIVTNTGNVTLTGVGITETAFSGTGPTPVADCPATVLIPGDSTTCTATYSLTQADVDAEEVFNTATSHGTPPVGAAVASAPSETTVPVTPTAAIHLQKRVDRTNVAGAGERVVFSYLVTNSGDSTLDGITITETSFTGTGSLAGAVCPTTTLAPGASTTCTSAYLITAADASATRVDNTATASGTTASGATVTSSPAAAAVTIGLLLALTGNALSTGIAAPATLLLATGIALLARRSAGWRKTG